MTKIYFLIKYFGKINKINYDKYTERKCNKYNILSDYIQYSVGNFINPAGKLNKMRFHLSW